MKLFNMFNKKNNSDNSNNNSNNKILEINNDLKIELEYDGAWFGELEYDFGKIKSNNIDIQINSYDLENNLDYQKETLKLFFEKWNSIQDKIIEASYNYYNEERRNLGYDVEGNEDYPELNESSEIIDMIEIVGVTVPISDDVSERKISIVFNCSWDEENGMGIRMANFNIIEVGYQDIAL